MRDVEQDPVGYREHVAEALADGWRFAGLHASRDGALVRALLVAPDGATRFESLVTSQRQAVSLVDLAPAAGWDEREAADLYGVGFAGHEPLRPLVDHEGPLAGWTVPVKGHDAHQVAVGPIHAGVIESGHFRFHVVGDLILGLDARLFYKHRGLEQAAEGETLERGLAFVSRACAACAVANGLAYAHACEEALGLSPVPELARVRTVLLELERTWSHLNDVAAVCAGTGLAAGNNHFAALTEKARRLNARLTGHRFLFGSVRVGGSDLELGSNEVRAAQTELEMLSREAELGWRSLLDNLSFQDRLGEIGVIAGVTALELGTVGPPGRAGGVRDDARINSTRLAYEGFEPVAARPRPAMSAPGSASGCSSSGSRSRCSQSCSTGRSGRRPQGPAVSSRGSGWEGSSARGATSCVVERNGDRIERIRLRTGSYANWPSVAAAAVGNLLPDFPLINKSFELCYACVDR